MNDREATRFFRGGELSRLMLFLALGAAGWVVVWRFLYPAASEPPEPARVISGTPPAFEPDTSPEFETVTDKTMLSFRDTAAYEKLLGMARGKSPAELAAAARRDVLYAHLWEDPSRFRGVPIHILGMARRVLYYPSKLSRTGWLYEAWIIDADLPKNPYVCVFEEAPDGFPVGPNISERVVFNGYFFKLMRYEAGDVPRAAPLLVGRVGWRPSPAGRSWSVPPAYWLAGGLAVMFAISLARWGLALRRSFQAVGRGGSAPERALDQISPEDLSAFLEAQARDEDPATEVDDPPDSRA